LAELIPEFDVMKSDTVLDIGTGPGILIPYLRNLIGAEGRVCSLDLSMPMLRQALLKPLLPWDLVIRADAHYLPFGRDRFDNVICFAAFPHFDDPSCALHEMARVCKPGGRITVAHLLSREELAAHHGGHDVVADDILPDAERMRNLFQDAGLKGFAVEDRPGKYLAQARKP
jgi:ubiquinone/menaquinone biosynthesis C-methylase UbiE